MKPLESTVVRKDLENQTFKAWQAANGEEKRELEQTLRELLYNHAKAVCYAILRRNDPPLQQEAADKVMMHLDLYEAEKALFTTWAHAILMRQMYSQRRTDRRRKEVSMDTPGFDLPGEPTIGLTDTLLTVQTLLDPEEYKMFEQIILLGATYDEAAATLGIPRGSLHRNWTQVTRKLKDGLTK